MAEKNNQIFARLGFVRENNIIKGTEEQVDVSFYTGEVILQTLRNKPDHVGQIEVETGKQSTYAEMEDKSVRCAIWMKKHGIDNGDIVVTCSHNHLDAYVPVFATFYLGAVYNAWSPDTNLDSARYLIKLLTPKLVFVCESAASVLQEAATLENINTEFVVFSSHSNLRCLNKLIREQSKDEVKNFIPKKINNPEELAAIILSSGTTAMPKPAMFSHRSFLLNICKKLYNHSNNRRMWYATLNWLSGISLTFTTLFSYDTRIIHMRPNAEEICKVIEKYKVSIVFFIPSLITYLAKSNAIEKYDLSSLKSIMFGGAQPNKAALEILQKRIPNVELNQIYGMTEFGRSIAFQYKKCNSYESIGFIVNNTEMKVVSLKTGKIVGPNTIGELRFKSESMMLGYYKNLEATKQAFDEEGWLRSGDLGYYNEHSEIFLLDRVNELIRYKNHLLSPNEIEQALMINPAVTEVAVVPISHKKDGEWPIAFVKIIPGSKVPGKDLIELSSALGEEKKLRGGIVFLDDLPKVTSAKIARHELKRVAKKFTHG